MFGFTQRFSKWGAVHIFRHPKQAMLVGWWLVEKATERMRRDTFCVRRISLSGRFFPKGGWSGSRSITASQDTRAFLQVYMELWAELLLRRPRVIGSLSVHLGEAIPLEQRSGGCCHIKLLVLQSSRMLVCSDNACCCSPSVEGFHSVIAGGQG